MTTRRKATDETTDETGPETAQDAPQDAPTWPDGLKVSPLALAGLMADPADAPHGLGLGRPAGKAEQDAKRLRSIARATLSEYQDEGYTVHEYDETTARELVATFAAKGRRSRSAADAVRAASGMTKGETDAAS